MRRLTLNGKLTCRIGKLGISLITVIHMLYSVYCFFPPAGAGRPKLFGLMVLLRFDEKRIMSYAEFNNA